jgi:hypothetical protein
MMLAPGGTRLKITIQRSVGIARLSSNDSPRRTGHCYG